MDSLIFPQSHQTVDCTADQLSKDVSSLIKQLNNPNSLVRSEAHDILSCIGAPVVPELLNALKSANTQVRWQIIKVFDSIQDPSTIPILMEQLKDDSAEIRWAASNALINLRREAIPALLNALTYDFDSLWMRQSAHHILRVLRENGKLTPAEDKVYQALEDIVPSVSVPWAAQKALEALRKENDNLLQQ